MTHKNICQSIVNNFFLPRDRTLVASGHVTARDKFLGTLALLFCSQFSSGHESNRNAADLSQIHTVCKIRILSIESGDFQTVKEAVADNVITVQLEDN